MTELTQENYYQDRERLSVSRFKNYIDCEARAYAIDSEEWSEEQDKTPLLLGNYVHSFFESPEAHQNFLAEEGKKMIAKSGTNKGGIKSDFVIGDKMIAALANDEKFLDLYHGYPSDDIQKELIVTGEIAGVPIKGKLDSVNLSRGYFVDLKTMKSIHNKEWSEELRMKVPAAVNNILNYGYHIQMAVYRELLDQMFSRNFRSVIVAVSKEQYPDKEVLAIDEEWLADGLAYFSNNVKRVWGVAKGEIKPIPCGRCGYCRNKKKLGRVVSLNDLIGG